VTGVWYHLFAIRIRIVFFYISHFFVNVARCDMRQSNGMTSEIFPVERLVLDGEGENIVHGGRSLFPLVGEVFESLGIRNVLVLGWGSQGPAQAPNIRDTLAEIGSPARVRVGLRAGSESEAKAMASGMEAIEMFQGVSEADLVICLINDAGQVAQYRDIVAAMKPGSTLGFSHGFLIGYLEGIGEKLRSDINIVGVCPKGMGPSVRKLYLQGRDIGGAGINSSVAVEQDATGHAWDIALAWAVAIGSPTIFETTLGMEWRSDLVGERSILLGAVWGIVEAMFQHYVVDEGAYPEEAFRLVVESLTGPINTAIASVGMRGLYESLSHDDQAKFRMAYDRAYDPLRSVIEAVYAEVDSGREIGRVITATKALKSRSMGKIDRTLMWRVGGNIRANRSVSDSIPVNPVLAGIYVAGIVAQADVLREHRHSWSEVVNESIIEAFASLIPFMHARGIAFMVDNCSITARLGTREWGPKFEHIIRQQVLVPFGNDEPVTNHFTYFMWHPVHDVLAECMKYQPPVSIAVV